MKIVELGDASSPLANYIPGARSEPLVITEHGSPTAVTLPLDNTDLEDIVLSTNAEFVALIERSQLRCRQEGGLCAVAMRRRVIDRA